MNIYPWQQQVWQTVCSAYQQQRLPHALLLTGPRGLGKVDFARCFAQFLLCQQPNKNSACGHCRGCHLLNCGNHPDFFEVTLMEESKQIKVDQIRALSEKLCKSAHAAGYQVVLLFPANQLNRSAANALLKTLEEPIGQVVMLLIADQLGTLPSTITSRCQRLTFSASAQASTTEWLNQQLNDSKNDAALLLGLADYAPLRAQQFAASEYLNLRDQVLQQLLLIRQQHINPLSGIENWLQADLELLLYSFITLIIDLLRLHYSVTPQTIYNFDRQVPLNTLLKQTNPINLAGLLTTLMDMQRMLTSQANVNWQLALEQLLLQWESNQ